MNYYNMEGNLKSLNYMSPGEYLLKKYITGIQRLTYNLLLVNPILIAECGLSLPNWLAIARGFGVKKAVVYVPTIVISGTLVGWFFGSFIF